MLAKEIFTLGMWIALFMSVESVAARDANPETTREFRQSFDGVSDGSLPRGWNVDATNSRGRLAEWKVVRDADASSAPRVLAVVKTSDAVGGDFNLCWTSDIVFRDGVIEVRIRADGGDEDQGGGVIWRARDANNYYVARYNPLEENFRIYYVKNGRRKQLASAENLAIKAGEWFALKIIHRGEKAEGFLNGKKYFEVADATFLEPGGVGLWTKADAASSFDDFWVTSLPRD